MKMKKEIRIRGIAFVLIQSYNRIVLRRRDKWSKVVKREGTRKMDGKS